MDRELEKESSGWLIATLKWLRNPSDWFAGTTYIFAFILLLFGLYVTFGMLWQISLAAWGSPLEDAKPDEALRNLLLGFAGLVGAPFIVWRTLIAEQQKNIQKENHYTDLYTKAVEGLGAYRQDKDEAGNDIYVPNIAVRIGSINALARIARESEKDHWPIMETLAAYIRENCSKSFIFNVIQEDIKSSLYALGRRNVFFDLKGELIFISLEKSNINNLNIYITEFNKIYFSASSFTKCNFIKINFKNCDFNYHTISNCEFVDCIFENCEIFRIFLKKNNTFTRCKFDKSHGDDLNKIKNAELCQETRKSLDIAISENNKN